MKKNIVVHWFNRDLRLSDSPALVAATQLGKILPVFIWNSAPNTLTARPLGGASRAWLQASLQALDKTLNEKLWVLEGDPISVLVNLCQWQNVSHLTYTQSADPAFAAVQDGVSQSLSSAGIKVQSFDGHTLWDLSTINKADGTPYRVFSPFYRKGCLSARPPRQPLSRPALDLFSSEDRPDWPQISDNKSWSAKLMKHWTVGETAAQERLQSFLKSGLNGYKTGRNMPAAEHVSRLSPHLSWGEVSPNQVWYAAEAAREGSADNRDIDHFQSELAWREFSFNLLQQHPTLAQDNWNTKFDTFPWHDKEAADTKAMILAWRRGQTGVPIVDAGMRELRHTGYMHNRVRMIVGSFLVKNIMLDWRYGERWFWDNLVDADPANNPASWQWVAGSGADAAPYFRIFNPITQTEKFDPDSTYIKRWVPELAQVPPAIIAAPWQANPIELLAAGVVLGKTYPHPIVDLKQSRSVALAAYETLNNNAQS